MHYIKIWCCFHGDHPSRRDPRVSWRSFFSDFERASYVWSPKQEQMGGVAKNFQGLRFALRAVQPSPADQHLRGDLDLNDGDLLHRWLSSSFQATSTVEPSQSRQPSGTDNVPSNSFRGQGEPFSYVSRHPAKVTRTARRDWMSDADGETNERPVERVQFGVSSSPSPNGGR